MEAVAGLDVVAVFVLPVKQDISAIVVGFIWHLEGASGAGVVAEVAVLIVQLEEIEQMVVDLRFQLLAGELTALEKGLQLGFGLLAFVRIGQREQGAEVGLGVLAIGACEQIVPLA